MHHPILLTKTTSSRRTSPGTSPNDNKAIGACVSALLAGLRPASSILLRRTAFPLLLLTAGLLLVQPCAGQGGTWTETGSLNAARGVHTATLLPNGKVLVAGGFDTIDVVLASAELYDPATGIWMTTGSLATARFDHTATLLPNGKVLVAGGVDSNLDILASAELYDPASGTWTATGSLAAARYWHTATLLPNGKVLVAGGYDSINVFASAELYDPASGTWTATGSLANGRWLHTATLLPNGKVLVAGGFDTSLNTLANAELYDPASGTSSETGSLNTARRLHTATLLPKGMVLVAGGRFDFNPYDLASAELYDPASGTWTTTGSLATRRHVHTATLLPSGMVLVAGGDGDSVLVSAELYDPASGTWTATGSLNTARRYHTGTLLQNGMVLVAGGFSFDIFSALASAELYVSDGGGGLTLVSAASVRGLFAIDLPLSGLSGVEDRGGSRNGRYLIVMTFNNEITSASNATVSCGPDATATATIDPSDAHKVNVVLVGVKRRCSESDVTITADVSDGSDSITASATMGLLIGDVNGDRVVDEADIHLARSYRGQKIDGTNFRADINDNGRIESSDVGLVRENLGDSL